jgi:hypothetical protein
VNDKDSAKSAAQQTKFKNEMMANEEMANYYKRFHECYEDK